jgi:hypothetical protein
MTGKRPQFDRAGAHACPQNNTCEAEVDCMPYPGWPGQQHAGCTYEDALFTSFGAPKNNIILLC